MGVLKIITGADNPVLRKKTARVPKVTKDVKKLVRDMVETMTAAEGVGLAAPQIGESLRICIAPVAGRFEALINPEITQKSDKTEIDEEGCLSLPGVFLKIERAKDITLTFTDVDGKEQERKLESFEARVVQHEVDHLDGVLIVDYKK